MSSPTENPELPDVPATTPAPESPTADTTDTATADTATASVPDDAALAALLAEWLPGQRWFAGRPGDPLTVGIAQRSALAGLPGVELVVVDTTTPSGTALYQVLVGWRADLPDHLTHALIGWSDGVAAYDALRDHEVSTPLLGALSAGTDLGPLRGEPEPDAEIDDTAPGLVSSAEQSNTSIIYGDSVILKVFRRLTPGVNPDAEVHRALLGAQSRHIAEPLGILAGTVAGTATTLALANRYFANSADGWSMATTSVRDLLAEGDLHADEVGGDFASEAERLGVAVAQVHADLAAALGTDVLTPDQVDAMLAQMAGDAAATAEVVPSVADHLDAIHAVYAAAGADRPTLTVQRIHGDLHLGQVLRTVNGWALIDFEGEPTRPLQERRALRSPLVDVAGMLRSFDYAAHQLALTGHSDAQQAYRAAEWSQRNRDAFCVGYASVRGSDPRDTGPLLRAFELAKAVYEVNYEHGHRPSWERIPLAAITDLVRDHPS